jgi:hypothetical protein
VTFAPSSAKLTDSLIHGHACKVRKTTLMFTPKRRKQMKKLFAVTLLLASGFAQANEGRISDPFSIGVVGRVCVQGKCKIYSDLRNVQVALSPDPSNPSAFEGHAEFDYTIEGISFSSTVTVSDFVFSGNHQINLFLKTFVAGSKRNLGSSEVIVNKLSDLNSIAQYSVPVSRGGVTIEPAIIIGPNQFSVLNKIRALSR